jgi:hypothetical protein
MKKNEQQKEVPEAVKKIVGAMVDQALSRCDKLGIARAEFYRAMLEVKKHYPKGTLEELLTRTFAHLKSEAN